MQKKNKKPFINYKNLENLNLSAINSKLKGKTSIPGDKSISQRALIIALISTGTTVIENILNSEDVQHTKKAVEMLGASIKTKEKGYILQVNGTGLGNFLSPVKPIYMGNSGTGTRLLIGLVAGSNATVTFYGDNSLSRRPMNRIIIPLEQMGAKFTCNKDFKLPITVTGALDNGFTLPINYKMPVPSAQVKSSIILAALTGRGNSVIIENKETRDNTESMLKHFGVEVKISKNKLNEKKITIGGVSHIGAKSINVPGDPSSAAFIVVAALITKNSEVVIEGIFYSKFRLKIFEVLKKMGANIEIIRKKNTQFCDIYVKYSKLKNVAINTNLNPSLIDEFPILSIAAANATGKMEMNSLGELRLKESDRLRAIYEGLNKCGVKATINNNDLIVYGSKNIVGNCTINSYQDHRIAMSFNILSLVTKKPILVIGNKSIKTSFPNFFDVLANLGVNVEKKHV